MVKLTKIKFPSRQLAFTLSAALLISLMPVTSSAAENSNMEVPSIINNTYTAATGSATIPDNSLSGTSTGGSVNTGNNAPDASTGGALTPDNSPSDTATGGAAAPDGSQTENPGTALPAVGTKITAGNYIYRVTGKNTVALKGFAKGVSLATVIARNQITYKKVVYKVTKIGSSAFKGQTGIKKVIIRKNITDIASNSFYNCKNITKITIRTGVTIIRKQAFMGCTKLKTVNITSTVLSQVKKNAFKNIKAGAVINVINKKARLAVKAAIPSNITVNQM